MASRGPGDISARAIGEAAPRQFRRRAESDAALAALLGSGAVVQVSNRPRSYHVIDQPENHISMTASTTAMADSRVPADEIRTLFDGRLAHHANRGLTDKAALFLAGRDAHDTLRRDVRLVPPQPDTSRCAHCNGPNDEHLLRALHGRILHARCYGKYRTAIDNDVDDLIAAALDIGTLKQET